MKIQQLVSKSDEILAKMLYFCQNCYILIRIMYTLINLVTGYLYGIFQTYEDADNFRLQLDDFYVWDIDKKDY